jgi:nucleoside-diphosphate kinase
MGITLTYIKPDAIKNKDCIKKIIQENGFEIIKEKAFSFSKELAEKFYEEHTGKRFKDGTTFDQLIEFSCSGECHALVLQKENAITDFRKLIGATKPENAEEGTIRKLFGTPNGGCANAIHGSDSDESVKREILLIFG